MEEVARVAAESAFGCAGQRASTASLAITVGAAKAGSSQQAAVSVVWGMGLTKGRDGTGRAESKARIESLIHTGMAEGAKVVVDGRSVRIPSYEQGYFLKPTILEDVSPDGQIAQTEIFGPVLALMHAQDIDEAIALVNHHHYGNMACLFTRTGRGEISMSAGRERRINVGVAAPMAFFPFVGGKSYLVTCGKGAMPWSSYREESIVGVGRGMTPTAEQADVPFSQAVARPLGYQITWQCNKGVETIFFLRGGRSRCHRSCRRYCTLAGSGYVRKFVVLSWSCSPSSRSHNRDDLSACLARASVRQHALETTTFGRETTTSPVSQDHRSPPSRQPQWPQKRQPECDGAAQRSAESADRARARPAGGWS